MIKDHSSAIVIDGTLTSGIKSYEYLNCNDLIELTITEGVTSIGERAFSKCKNLRKVTLPESISFIGNSAFSDCENLEEIVLPKNLKKLNYRVLAGCKRLRKIIIPEGVEELDWAVFSGCENLEEIVLPSSIKNINKQIFLNCKRLKKVVLPKNITHLPDEFFKGCSSLDIELPDSIITLGKSVFENCSKLSKFPSNVVKFDIDCFKNCKRLEKVALNPNISFLPDGSFDGCINLSAISSPKAELVIGERCFRNCKRLDSIPSFVSNYNKQSFENCINLSEIDITDSNIPFACFRGCTNIKKINNEDKIYRLGTFAFSGCKNLEEISLRYIADIPAEAFSNCKKLVRTRLNSNIGSIGPRAFYGCEVLKDIKLPEGARVIRKEAFRNCNSIEEITIPPNLKTIGPAAFGNMNSLATINVSPFNKDFVTPDHKILINSMQQRLVLYTSGCKDTSYSLKDYNVELDMFEHELIKPITSIAPYAFAGAKNLQELTICSCTVDIDCTSFVDCDYLKKLNIDVISLFSCPGFKIRNNLHYYFPANSKKPCSLPFEIVEFTGDNLVQIYPDALKYFYNVREIVLPRSQNYSISTGSFCDCSKLEKVNIPKNVFNISAKAFPSSTKLLFDNGLAITGLKELIHNNEFIGDYKLYVLDDDSYYIEQNDMITAITKTDIDNTCSHSEEIRNNPILYFDFKNDLLDHDFTEEILFNGILMANMSLENRKILFENINKDDKFAFNVLKHSGILDKRDETTLTLLKDNNFSKVVNYIKLLKQENITVPILYNKLLMNYLPVEDFGKLITYDLPLLIKIINDSKLLEILPNENFSGDLFSELNLIEYILSNNTIAKFMAYIKEYKIKDRYLMNKPFIAIADNPLASNFFKVFDANTKRLLKMSDILEHPSSAKENLNDLLNLLKITGALEEDPIIRQRASTFIAEKMFDSFFENDENNAFRVVGDDIHRIFHFADIREEFDSEFAAFFIENYQELIARERVSSGFIERVYLNFREISKTSTSDKGSQRKLKVTMDKCNSYLTAIKFDNVSEENHDFAVLLGAWYDKNSVWQDAQDVFNESLEAPRNIFTKVIIDENGNTIYDTDPINDIKGFVDGGFSYEWLPKQDYYNLLLGKYCNCCAHIAGAGQGIMRASMILDNCQNLVVKNNFGEIIAKSTLYVNKDAGYAVFNNVESSLSYRKQEDLEKIYQAFLKGAQAFINVYNENNEEMPISSISVGTNRNTILNFLTDENHPIVDIRQALSYGKYSIDNWSNYDGDWSHGQRLVLTNKQRIRRD